MARLYELEIDTQYLPLSIYTLGVDYTDARVQVGNRNRGRGIAPFDKHDSTKSIIGHPPKQCSKNVSAMKCMNVD